MPTGFDAWFTSTPLGVPLRYEVDTEAVVLLLPVGTRLASLESAPFFKGVFPAFVPALAIADLGHFVLRKTAPPGEGVEPAVLVARLAQAGQRPAWAVRDHPRGALKVVLGEIVLAFGTPMVQPQVERLLEGADWRVRRSLAPYAPHAFVLSPPAGITAPALGDALRRFRRLPGAIASYPVAPGDANKGRSHALPDLWHLGSPDALARGAGSTQIGGAPRGANVRAAWPVSGGGVGVTIAILEGGPVDVTHPQLSGTIGGVSKLAEAVDLTVEQQPAPMPDAHSADGLHGTACAGVALARGMIETDGGTGAPHQAVGIAPNARLLAIRCAAGVGSLAEADAISYAAQRADVISCSWGPEVEPPAISRLPDHSRWALEYALREGRQGRGCVVCFSTGNDSTRTQTTDLNEYANCPGVTAVGACDHLGQGTRYSVRGPAVAFVFPSSADTTNATYRRIATIQPGATPGLRYFPWIGTTSAACAAAAGAAALLLAACPTLSGREVARALRATCQDAAAVHADAPPQHQVGAGRVDCGAAVGSVARRCVLGRPVPWPPDAEPLLDPPVP